MTSVHRMHKDSGNQMIVHQNWKEEEMQFNWNYYCARGFKDSKENCWSV